MKLDTRSTAHGPVMGGSYPLNGPIDTDWEPGVGNLVTLHSGNVVVLGRITKAAGRTYEGEVMGFEQHDDIEFEGVKIGDTIPFSYAQLFSVSR